MFVLHLRERWVRPNGVCLGFSNDHRSSMETKDENRWILIFTSDPCANWFPSEKQAEWPSDRRRCSRNPRENYKIRRSSSLASHTTHHASSSRYSRWSLSSSHIDRCCWLSNGEKGRPLHEFVTFSRSQIGRGDLHPSSIHQQLGSIFVSCERRQRSTVH